MIAAIDSYKIAPTLVELSAQVPIVAYANEVYSTGVDAKAVAFFVDLGARLGDFLVEHIRGLNLERPAVIAFVMGPKGAAWSDDMESGVLQALYRDQDMRDRIRVVSQKHGHTKSKMQEKLVRLVLEQNEGIDFLIGTAPAIERAAAIRSEYQSRHPHLQLAAAYFNASLYPAVAKGDVLAAGWDDIPETGRLAVSMLLNLVRGEPVGINGEGLPYRVAPTMQILTPQNITLFPMESLFGPDHYDPKVTH